MSALARALLPPSDATRLAPLPRADLPHGALIHSSILFCEKDPERPEGWSLLRRDELPLDPRVADQLFQTSEGLSAS